MREKVVQIMIRIKNRLNKIIDVTIICYENVDLNVISLSF